MNPPTSTQEMFFLHQYLMRYIKNVFLLGTLVSLSGLVVSMLAMGPKVASSNLAKNDGFLWVTKIHSMHFLQSGSKVISPIS
jgi:hypothetical protein